MLLSINRNYLTPFLWRDNAIFFNVHLLFKILLFRFVSKTIKFSEKMIITKKIRFINIFCFCLRHFLIFLVFSEKTVKNKKISVFTVIFQDPVTCANFDYFSRNQDPKTR